LKFLADAMLGKLARWLRMMGYDVVYSVKLGDDELLGMAKAEGRVLLTRDLELYKRAISRGSEAFFVEGKTESDRLAEVAGRFGLPLAIDMDRAYCPICNTPIKSATKEQLKDKLEPNTYRYYDQFWQCPNCGQVYWQGAHWKQITKTLTQAHQKLSGSN
jgi:uncharacterized protein with PIN domain